MKEHFGNWFTSRVAKGVNDNDCWLWLGGTNRKGYGRTSWGPAHRVAYELEYGTIEDTTLHVHHKCGVRFCVNPKHLELLTASEHGRLHAESRRARARGTSPCDGVDKSRKEADSLN